MRRLLPALAVVALLLVTASAHAGRWGCGGGGWYGPRVNVGAGFGSGWGGGYCGPRWGGGWYGPPVVVYRAAPVYYVPARPVLVAVPRTGQATLVRVQAQLSRLGYYRGEVDGDFGPQTSRALRQFQAENGLPITGRIDRATLATLGT